MHFYKIEMRDNKALVDYLISISVLKTERIINAFLYVDRKDFVLEEYKDEAYENYPLSIGYGQTISQPYTVAFMLELLQPEEEDIILDVGSGSGWATALLAYIASKGKVIGVEIIKQLVEFGKNNIKKYNFNNVKILHADKIPSLTNRFDKILVSASANNVPDELLSVTKDVSRIVIPVLSSIILINKENKKIHTEEYYGFAFVPLK